MKTTMLKLSTMVISLLAIASGVQFQGTESAEPALAFSVFPGSLRPVAPEVLTVFDPIMIPGQSVGPVTAETSYADLAKLFDPARLTDVEAPIGEGFTQPGTRVDLGEQQSFTVVWADAKRSQVAEVRELGSDWQTPEGIRAGISLGELERILGPFQLYGFAWDYGGTVILGDTTLDSYEDQLIVRLQPTQLETRQAHAFREVIGDELFDSSHESFDEINPVVDEIVIGLATPKAQP